MQLMLGGRYSVQSIAKVGQETIVDLKEDRLLVAHPLIERPLRDVGRFGDVVGRGSLVPILLEQVCRGIKDPGAKRVVLSGGGAHHNKSSFQHPGIPAGRVADQGTVRSVYSSLGYRLRAAQRSN